MSFEAADENFDGENVDCTFLLDGVTVTVTPRELARRIEARSAETQFDGLTTCNPNSRKAAHHRKQLAKELLEVYFQRAKEMGVTVRIRSKAMVRTATPEMFIFHHRDAE